MQPEINSPRNYGVPHDVWRSAQLRAFQFAEAHRQKIRDKEDVPKYIFMELPTGSGKSGIATALGKDGKVTVLVHTLALLDQYEQIYDFAIVKGRQEYMCVLGEKVRKWSDKMMERLPTAADCHFEKMDDCSEAASCPYIIAKRKALSARRSACTYRYVALSKGMQRRGGMLILDEAHSAPHEWLDFASFEISEERRLKYNLPQFPYPNGYGDMNKGGLINTIAFDRLGEWFASSIRATYVHQALSNDEAKKKQFNLNLQRIMGNVMEGVQYFFECGPGVGSKSTRVNGNYKRIPSPGLRLRALTAAPIAHRVWQYKEAVMFMSATIGEPKPLADQLGIDEYVYDTFPHPIPKEKRPVFNLGMQRMTHANISKNPRMYGLQARLIKSLIDTFPDDWRGIILTSSYKKIRELTAKMMKWYPTRIFDPERKIYGTRRVEQFTASPMPGLIAIETIQGWGQGLDFKGNLARFIVIAGVQFSNPSDPYTQARRKMPGGGNFYYYTAYNSVVQGAGRVVRGAKYENGDYFTNIIAIADGSATTPTALRYYPKWFKEAMLPMNKEEIKILLEDEPQEPYYNPFIPADDIPF